MKGKEKFWMLMVFLMALLCSGAGLAYAADVEVNKDEFNKEWQETYNEIAAIDPAAAKAFVEETQKAFANGEVGYAAGDLAGTSNDALRSPSGVPGADAAAGYGPPPGGGPGNIMGDAYLKEKGLSDQQISEVRKAEEVLGAEAAKVDWANLTTEERTAMDASFQQRFTEMTGINPAEVFGPPPAGGYGPMSGGPGAFGDMNVHNTGPGAWGGMVTGMQGGPPMGEGMANPAVFGGGSYGPPGGAPMGEQHFEGPMMGTMPEGFQPPSGFEAPEGFAGFAPPEGFTPPDSFTPPPTPEGAVTEYVAPAGPAPTEPAPTEPAP